MRLLCYILIIYIALLKHIIFLYYICLFYTPIGAVYIALCFVCEIYIFKNIYQFVFSFRTFYYLCGAIV